MTALKTHPRAKRGAELTVPLSNVPVGFAIILVAFAYLEEDGTLLAAALTVSLLLFAVGATALWGSIAATVSLTS